MTKFYSMIFFASLILMSACSGKSKIKTGNWELDIDTYVASIKEKADSFVLAPARKQMEPYLEYDYIKTILIDDKEKAEQMDSTEIMEFGKKYVEDELAKQLVEYWKKEKENLKKISLLFLDKGELVLRKDGHAISNSKWELIDKDTKLKIAYPEPKIEMIGTSYIEKYPIEVDKDTKYQEMEFEILKMTENEIELKTFMGLATEEMNPKIVFKYAD